MPVHRAGADYTGCTDSYGHLGDTWRTLGRGGVLALAGGRPAAHRWRL